MSENQTQDYLKISTARCKKLFTSHGIARVKKEVFDVIRAKIEEIMVGHVKESIVVENKTITEKSVIVEPTKKTESFLMRTPLKKKLREYIKKHYDITRISKDALVKLQLLIEDDIDKLCEAANEILVKNSRTILFPEDIEEAFYLTHKKEPSTS